MRILTHLIAAMTQLLSFLSRSFYQRGRIQVGRRSSGAFLASRSRCCSSICEESVGEAKQSRFWICDYFIDLLRIFAFFEQYSNDYICNSYTAVVPAAHKPSGFDTVVRFGCSRWHCCYEEARLPLSHEYHMQGRITSDTPCRVEH